MAVVFNHQTNTVSVSSGTLAVAKATGTAKRSIASGEACVANTDGTISAAKSVTYADSSSSQINPAVGGNSSSSSVYCSGINRVVVAARDTSTTNYGRAYVATVTATSVTPGSMVTFVTANCTGTKVAYSPSLGIVAIAYTLSTGLYVILGTPTTTTITFGSAVQISTSANVSFDLVFDESTQRLVVAYVDFGAPAYTVYAFVGSTSGTTLTFGSAVTLADTYKAIALAYSPVAQKVVFGGASNVAFAGVRACVGTVSGTTISFGTSVLVNAGSAVYGGAWAYYTPTDSMVLLYSNNTDARYAVGTVSGTSISFGTPGTASAGVFSSGGGAAVGAYDSNADRIVVAYQRSISQSGFVSGAVSGTTITFGSNVQIAGVAMSAVDLNLNYIPALTKVLDSYTNNTTGTVCFALLQAGYTIPSPLTSTNFVGFAADSAADTAAVPILTYGAVSGAQSGLTTGQQYYVQTNGTLSTTPGSPSVFAGTAISATALIVKA